MGLKRETLRHSAVYSASSVLSKLVGFFMLPFYARIFETEGYGIIALIDASVGFLSIAFAAGSHYAILKIYHEEPEPRKKLVISTGIWTVWWLSLLCVPLPALVSPWISSLLLGDAALWPLIVLALATFVIDMGGQSASAFLTIRQQSVLYSFVNLLLLVLVLTLNIVLVIYLRVGLIGIFISSLITSSVGSLIFHWAAIRQHGLHYDTDIGRKLRAFWFPLIPGELISYASRQIEPYLVRFLISLEGVGILQMAYKFPPLINLFVTLPFMRAWRTKSLEIGALASGPQEIASMFTLYMYLTLFSAVFVAANISTLLVILTPPSFWPAAAIARIDVVTTVTAAASAYLNFGLLYRKQTGLITQIRLVTAPIKIALSIALIITVGLAGAAYSAMVMEFVLCLWIFRKAQLAYQLPLEYTKLAVLSVSAFALVAMIDYLPALAGGLIDALESFVLNNLIAYLAYTPLGDWQGGKLVHILGEHARDFARLVLNTCLCLLYGTLIVVVKPDWVRYGRRRFTPAA